MMKLFLIETGFDVSGFKEHSKDIFILRVSDVLMEHNFTYDTLTTTQTFIIQDEIKNKLKKLNNLKKCQVVYLFVDKIHTSFINFVQDFILENRIKINSFEIYRNISK